MSMWRRGRSAALASVIVTLVFAGQASAGSKPVLELFTSQSCSSCPAADALFERYIARGDVIALSFHVDYWDHYGWKDTFSQAAFSDRQRRYAEARGDGKVYTPQVVVNGRVHVTGSSAAAIEAGISKTSGDAQRERVDLRLSQGPRGISVEVGGARESLRERRAGTLFLALVERSKEVAIARGENAGRNVTYHNIVRSLRKVGTWGGTPVTIDIPETDLAVGEARQAVVLLQQGDGDGGPILGAVELGTREPALP